MTRKPSKQSDATPAAQVAHLMGEMTEVALAGQVQGAGGVGQAKGRQRIGGLFVHHMHARSQMNDGALVDQAAGPVLVGGQLHGCDGRARRELARSTRCTQHPMAIAPQSCVQRLSNKSGRSSQQNVTRGGVHGSAGLDQTVRFT